MGIMAEAEAALVEEKGEPLDDEEKEIAGKMWEAFKAGDEEEMKKLHARAEKKMKRKGGKGDKGPKGKGGEGKGPKGKGGKGEGRGEGKGEGKGGKKLVLVSEEKGNQGMKKAMGADDDMPTREEMKEFKDQWDQLDDKQKDEAEKVIMAEAEAALVEEKGEPLDDEEKEIAGKMWEAFKKGDEEEMKKLHARAE